MRLSRWERLLFFIRWIKIYKFSAILCEVLFLLLNKKYWCNIFIIEIDNNNYKLHYAHTTKKRIK